MLDCRDGGPGPASRRPPGVAESSMPHAGRPRRPGFAGRSVAMSPRADRLSGGGMVMDGGRDGRRGECHGTRTGLAPGRGGDPRPSLRTPARRLSFPAAPAPGGTGQLGAPSAATGPRASALTLSNRIPPADSGRLASCVDRPGHDRLASSAVLDHGHIPRDRDVPLDDPGLLDVGAWGPHRRRCPAGRCIPRGSA